MIPPGHGWKNVFPSRLRSLTLDDLQSRLAKISKFYPGQPVIIRADRDTKYESLVAVIDSCRAADVWNFSLATENEPTK